MKKNLKKVLAAGLVASMVMGTSIVALAANVDNTNGSDAGVAGHTVEITKNYNLIDESNGSVSPAETFNFTITEKSVTDAAVGITKENMPKAAVGMVEYSSGEAGSANGAKKLTVKLPKYDSVGIYTYEIREIAGNTQGVTYFDGPITLVVTVTQDKTGKLVFAGVHCESPVDKNSVSGKKTDNFANTYSAGTLDVTKVVTGNLGDQTKEFSVDVTFTAPTYTYADSTYCTVKEAINYTDDGKGFTVAVGDWKVEGEKATATKTITLKHNETVTFTNIPEGVSYTVDEQDYSADGYDDPIYALNDKELSKVVEEDNAETPDIVETKTIYDVNAANTIEDKTADKVVITNNKGVTVDTGISLDSMPYLMTLALSAMGALGFAGKRRKEEDEI